jgi:hypothetical protein
MTDIATRHLVLAKWLTVAQAAKRYGVCDRTVRLWLARWPVGVKINGAAYRISEPLLDLLVGGDPDERASVEAFLEGKPAGPLVCRAFGRCGALAALETFVFERARPGIEWLAEAAKIQRKAAEKPETVT